MRLRASQSREVVRGGAPASLAESRYAAWFKGCGVEEQTLGACSSSSRVQSAEGYPVAQPKIEVVVGVECRESARVSQEKVCVMLDAGVGVLQQWLCALFFCV